MASFAAIDFETADQGRDSACALAIVLARDGRIVDRATYLIRPPRSRFRFTYLHGIAWEDVCDQPSFGQLWPEIAAPLADADVLVAHNAPFDKGVLHACCAAAGIAPPETRFACTVRLARQTWDIRPTRLPDVCRHLRIPLTHHDALSDAEACARIALTALAQGAEI